MSDAVLYLLTLVASLVCAPQYQSPCRNCRPRLSLLARRFELAMFRGAWLNMSCGCLLPGCAPCALACGVPCSGGDGARAVVQDQCLCFLPDCGVCRPGQRHDLDEPGRRRSRTPRRPPRRDIRRKVGVKRPLEAEVEEDLEADPDPTGSLSIQRVDSTRAANRWQSIARSLASVQGHAKFIDSAPWDFWELWSGSGHLTRAAQEKGLAVGPSVDMLPNSALPRLLLDLMAPADVELLWWLLQQYRPQHVHVAPPCTFWCKMGRWGAVRTEQEWRRLREEALHHLSLAARVMQWQHSRGRTGSLEQPSGCISWRLTPVEDLLELEGWRKFIWPSCRYEHRDPGSGRLFLKRQGVVANIDLAHMCVPCTCPRGSHQCVHGVVKGGPRHGEKRSVISGEYPMPMCRAMAEAVRQRWRPMG